MSRRIGEGLIEVVAILKAVYVEKGPEVAATTTKALYFFRYLPNE